MRDCRHGAEVARDGARAALPWPGAMGVEPVGRALDLAAPVRRRIDRDVKAATPATGPHRRKGS